MNGLAPADVDMMVESENEMDTDALYNDEEEDNIIIEADHIPPTPATGPTEIEMVGVDEGEDDSLDVDGDETLPEGAPLETDITLDEAEKVETTTIVEDREPSVPGEEIVLEEEPAPTENKDVPELTPSALPAPLDGDPHTDTAAPTNGTDSVVQESTKPPADAETDSFVLVEPPSDSETNGKPDELTQTDDASSKQDASAAVDDEHVHAGDDQDDSFSSFSDISSANFPSDFFLPTILTYPASTSIPTPSSYSLFHTFDAEEVHPVLLGSNADLFCAPLSELFDALREEAAFSVEDKALNMEDEGGTLEWVLEHENEGVALVIGEDNRHASEFTLQDLAKLHSHCGLGAPMRLKLRTGGTRFLLRVHKIQEIRREMDEEVGSDAGEHTEDWHHDGEAPLSEHVDEEEHMNSHAPSFETADASEAERQDFPNGPDDPTAKQSSTIEDPASELAAEEAKDETTEDTLTTAPGAIEEATLVVTGNEDVEIPAGAVPSVNDRGDLDADATRGLYDDDEDEDEQTETVEQTIEAAAAPPVDEAGAEETEELAPEIEAEAAAATTSLDAVESVPIPPQFLVYDEGAEQAIHLDNAPSAQGSGATSASTIVTETSAAEPASISTRRSTRLHPSDAAGPSPSTTTDNKAVSAPPSTLAVPDDAAPYAGDGSDDVDLYADSPLPSKPVDPVEEDAIEPLGLGDAAEVQENGSTEDGPDQEPTTEDVNEADSDHTLAESVEDPVDGEANGKDGGGASPKRRYDSLAKDEETPEAVEVRDPKRHKAL